MDNNNNNNTSMRTYMHTNTRAGGANKYEYCSLQYRLSHKKPKSVLSFSFLLLFQIKIREFLSYSCTNPPDSWHEVRQFLISSKKSQPAFRTTAFLVSGIPVVLNIMGD